jgi:hypothetical protein
LKNPYITTVIAVWLFTNRVVVFGIFNFERGLSLNDKITWVSKQLRSFDIWIFEGLHGGIIYAFLVGILSMMLFSLVTGGGKALYKWINKYSINLLQRVDGPNWISIKAFDKIYLENETLSKNNKELKKEIEGLENDIKLKNEQLLGYRNEPVGEYTVNTNKKPVTDKSELPEAILVDKIIKEGYIKEFESVLSKIAKDEFIPTSKEVDFFIMKNLIEMDRRVVNSSELAKYKLTSWGNLAKDYYAVHY